MPQRLATALMELYISAQVDRVELLYHHFKNMAEQVLTEKVFLPVSLPEADPESASSNYILEPSAEQLLALLLPKVLHLNIYTTLLDTVTSEHAARMLAHADSQRQRQRPDPGTDVTIQQKPPAGHHQ